jgi:hypothetical protein
MGANYRIKSICNIYGEIQFDSEQKSVPRLALEYFLVKSLAFRMGISGGQYLYSFGLGYSFSNFRTDLSFSRHETLGTTPSIDLIYAW